MAASAERAGLAARRPRPAHERPELDRRLVEQRPLPRPRRQLAPEPREQPRARSCPARPCRARRRTRRAPPRCTARRPAARVRSSGQPCAATTRTPRAAQRAPVVAEPDPRAQHVRHRRRRQRRRRRPALQPRLVARDHARDLRLLEHHLRDEDRVGVRGPPPRQVAAVRRVPVEQLRRSRLAVEVPDVARALTITSSPSMPVQTPTLSLSG